MEKNKLENRLEILEMEVQQLKDLLDELKNQLGHPVSGQPEEILSVNEAMDLLGLPRHVIYAKTLSGEIPGFRIGKLYKYKRSELLQWQQAESRRNHIDKYVDKYLLEHKMKA